LPVSTKTAVIAGREWHFEYYCDDVYGATHFDECRKEWAFVLFSRDASRAAFTAVDHDSGFADQSNAVSFLRKAAARRL
jgi:hypothetical protein